jgi:hypothetical protein
MIANPDDSVAQVAWQKPGKATIAALVSKAGCEKEYSDTVSITDLPEPVDQLVKKAHPSEDTLVILCQLHINETSKDFFYTWGYEKKSNGESIIVSNQGEQCYWAFANPDTIQFLYFVEISYKSKTSCRTRTYYHPVKEVTSAGDHSCLIFPNPSPGIFNITIAHQAKGPFSLTILDARGRMVLVKDYFKEKEVQTFRGISAPLPSSFYILSIRFKSGEEMVTKLVIL